MYGLTTGLNDCSVLCFPLTVQVDRSIKNVQELMIQIKWDNEKIQNICPNDVNTHIEK